jgi:TonB family protein
MRFLRPAVLLALLAPAGLAAQAPDRCAVVPDSIVPPTEQQVREADEMREGLRGILQRHGQAAEGLLMVDVDSTRRGRLLFMDAEIPDTTRAAVLAHVAEYLQALPGGRGYQALIRMDATYPAVAPGVRRCRPDLLTYGNLNDHVAEVERGHPAAGRHQGNPLQQRMTLLLVVSREGHVAYAEVLDPTGDEYLDRHAVEIAKMLRFDPASLDEVPIDVRLRFPLGFRIR